MEFSTPLFPKCWAIGDPHLGRDFKNGTPLHRRGERERLQHDQMQRELARDVDVNVMVGDLFDKPFVPLPVVYTAAQMYIDAAQARPDTTFVVMPGNHDLPRQVGIRGAWDLFVMAVRWLPNIVVAEGPYLHGDIALFPWQWDMSAGAQLEVLGNADYHTAIGHWDLSDFGSGSTDHLCPADRMDVHQIISGHFHVAGDYTVGGKTVHCTGSLQPYSHGEDPDGGLYVTVDLSEALARDDLRDKCVRVILQPGESLPDLDCLSLVPKRVDAPTELIEIEVGTGAFNLSQVLVEEFADRCVPEPVQLFIKERIGDLA